MSQHETPGAFSNACNAAARISLRHPNDVAHIVSVFLNVSAERGWRLVQEKDVAPGSEQMAPGSMR